MLSIWKSINEWKLDTDVGYTYKLIIDTVLLFSFFMDIEDYNNLFWQCWVCCSFLLEPCGWGWYGVSGLSNKQMQGLLDLAWILASYKMVCEVGRGYLCLNPPWNLPFYTPVSKIRWSIKVTAMVCLLGVVRTGK